MNTGPTVIPIAGGKGGVGKTFLTANLGIALAEMGNPTVAVDMDLGGSNLHSFLGLSNRFPGIGDFLKARSAELEELLVSTESPNLQFLPGDGLTPFMANIPYAQKVRLISSIKRLPVEYILLDLGAGTSFNTLDFFRISPHGFVITTPEYPSIMGMLVFLKHFLLRVIERTFAKDRQIHDLMRSLYKQPMTYQKMSIRVLRSRIDEISREAGERMTELCNKYRPRIVFNMGDHPEEIKIAEQINNSLESILSIEADYFGYIFYDSTVRESVKKGTTLLPHYRESMAAVCLKRVAERIIKYLDMEVKNSAQHLLDHTWKLYESLA
jgi:flagellar biosynthesis protein FlhG